MSREPREVWVKRVARWHDSGLSAREFAAELGVSHHTLTSWKSRLKRENGRDTSRRKLTATMAASDGRVQVPFVEVAASSLSEVAPECFEIERSGWQVRIPQSFDADALRRLLSVLGSRS